MWYLKSAFDAYQKVQDTVQSRLGEVQSAILSPVETVKRFLGGKPAPPPARPQAELAVLRKRVAELEARLKRAPAKRRKSGNR